MSPTRSRVPARLTAVIMFLGIAVLVAGGVALAQPPGNTPGGQARSAAYFARVGDDGAGAVLVASRGVTSVSLVGDDSPSYLVTFANPVDTCGWTVSINPFFGGPPGGFGVPTVGLDWDNTLDPQAQTPDPTVLRVRLFGYDENGSLFPTGIGGPGSVDTFTVVANC